MTTNTPAMSAMRQSIAEFFKFCSTCFIGYSKQFQKTQNPNDTAGHRLEPGPRCVLTKLSKWSYLQTVTDASVTPLQRSSFFMWPCKTTSRLARVTGVGFRKMAFIGIFLSPAR